MAMKRRKNNSERAKTELKPLTLLHHKTKEKGTNKGEKLIKGRKNRKVNRKE